MINNRDWVVGIDPGNNTGMAIYSRELEGLKTLWTSNFWSSFFFLRDNLQSIHHVVIEVPDSKNVWHPSKGNIPAIQRTAVNVGGVLREAHLLAMGAEVIGLRVTRVNPRGKINAKRFKELTGWKGKSNEHTRDAGMMAFRHVV